MHSWEKVQKDMQDDLSLMQEIDQLRAMLS